MKKNVIWLLSIFVIILIIITAIYIMQLNTAKDVQNNYNEEIEFFNQYKDKQFDVTDFISIMNKAIENNRNYEVKQDENKMFIEDDNYSIKVFLRLDDREELIPMEALLLSEEGGAEKINELFADIVYRYDSIEYHESTGRVKKIIIYGFTKTAEAPLNPYDQE